MLLLLLCCSNRCFFLDYQSCLLIQIAYSTVSLYYQKVLNFNNLNTEGFLIKVRQFFYTTSLFLTLSLLQRHYFFSQNSQKTKILWDGNGNNIKKKTMKINKTEWFLINKIFVVLNKKCLVNSSKKF